MHAECRGRRGVAVLRERVGFADERDIVVEGGDLRGREMKPCGDVAQGILQITGVVDADDGFSCVAGQYFRDASTHI